MITVTLSIDSAIRFLVQSQQEAQYKREINRIAGGDWHIGFTQRPRALLDSWSSSYVQEQL